MEIKPLSPLVLATALLGLFLRDYPEFKKLLLEEPMIDTITAAIIHVREISPQHTPEETFQRILATILEEYEQ